MGDKVSSFERHRMIEQIDQQTNMEVLRRELLNDSIQLPLKLLAYYTAPINNQGTYFAEFVRSCIDAMNHVILFGVNKLDLRPSSKYPYGIEKVKNMVVLIPGMLFLYFGFEIQFEQIHSIYQGLHLEQDDSHNPTSFILYLLSIGVETNIIRKNLVSASKLDEGNADKNFIQKIKTIFAGRDPVLQAVLFENAITLSSTLVPLISTVLTVFIPSPWYEVVGSIFIGTIQIKLGYHLIKKNLLKLMGEESLDKADMAKIDLIIRSNPFVKEVQNQKAVMIGQRKFRYAAEITFDNKKIQKEIMDDFHEKMERIVYTNEHSDREDYLKSLMATITDKLLAKLHTEIEKISASIKNAYPNCVQDDLETNHSSLADEHEEEELENRLFFMQLDDKSEVPFEKWIIEAADHTINYLNQRDKRSTVDSYLTSDDYLRSLEYSKLSDHMDPEI